MDVLSRRGRIGLTSPGRTLFVLINGVSRFRRPEGLRLGAGLAALCIASLSFFSCTNLTQVRQENAAGVLRMYRSRPLEAVTNGKSVLTLDECVGIALRHSLDIQTALWEEQVRSSLAGSARLKMLPRLESSYELSQRDRPAWSRSDVQALGGSDIGSPDGKGEGLWERTGPQPGTGVTNYSTARERGQRMWNTQLKWSPMDAVMARYLACVRNNETIHARYQRVRVAQQLVATVTGTFYRLLSLSLALPKAQALEGNRRSIVRDLASLDDSAMVDKQELITARTLLSEASNQLAETYVSIEKQKEILATAMHISPCSVYSVAGSLLPLPSPCLDSCRLETDALVNRPEVYQADLTFLNSVADHKRSIAKLFPRVDTFLGYFRDENKFVENRNWTDGGLRITWDLMDFAAGLLEQGAAKEKMFKSDQERALISVGILTQVKLKTLEAIRLMEKFRKNADLLTQANEALRVAKETEQAKERGAPQSVMRIARQRALCNVLQAEIDRLVTLGDTQAAVAELAGAVGTNYPVSVAHPVPSSADPVSSVASRSMQGVSAVAAQATQAVRAAARPIVNIFSPSMKR